jgi:hypothetical protein
MIQSDKYLVPYTVPAAIRACLETRRPQLARIEADKMHPLSLGEQKGLIHLIADLVTMLDEQEKELRRAVTSVTSLRSLARQLEAHAEAIMLAVEACGIGEVEQ